MVGCVTTKLEFWHIRLRLGQDTRGDTEVGFDVHLGDIFVRHWLFLYVDGFTTRGGTECQQMDDVL